MKGKRSRGLSLLLVLSMLCTTLFFGSVFSASAEVHYGDPNADGNIDAADALAALQHSVNLSVLEGDAFESADVDNNNQVNASDALMILQYSVELIEVFPVEKSGTVSIPWSTDTMAYAQTREETDPGPIRTTFQQSGGYTATDDVQSDSTMVYIGTIAGAETQYNSWKENKQNCAQESLDIMTAGGRDNGVEYFSMYPEREDFDACKRSDGSIYYHGGGTTVPYMVPTRYYREYKIQLIDTLCKLGPGFIAVEEPESFIGAEYSEGFQEEWLDYYDTEFVDPASSAEARYMSSKLMTHLWMTMIDSIGEYMNEHYPDIDLVVATHSTANYTHWNIISAVNAFTSSEYVDGIIGQTWSDTVNSAVMYGGTSQVRLFEAAFSEYATYADSMQEGQTVYTLTDAKADNPDLTWEDYRNMWEKTLVAELMQQDIHNFQECVWPSRGFTVAPDDYKTVQLAAFNALGQIGGQASTLYAGTPGIYYGLGDSISWQSGYQYMSNNATSLYGFTVPLVEKGIPVGIISLDYLDSVEDLAGVKVLALSYDAVKPQSEQVNEAVAQWVREGGTLLYLGGFNDYDQISTEWWTQKGQTPYENLIEHLGLDVTVGTMTDFLSFYQWDGPAGYGESFNGNKFVDGNTALYTSIYTGDSVDSILSNEYGVFGFEAAVGEGHVISVGLPSSYFAAVADGPQQLRDLVEYATTFTDVTYVETDLMAIQRGNFIAAQALDGSDGETLTGNFIDLFDADLPVITTQELEAGKSAFLYDITSLLDSDTPRFAYTGGVLKSDVTETADTTTFSIGGPTDATSATRLLGNGKYPESVTATVNGNRIGNLVWTWDNATSSLLIKVPHTADETVEITVEWGDARVEDTPDYEWATSTYVTSSRDADADFIYRNTSTARVAFRQSEYDTELVYRFDLSELGEAYFDLEVFGNYLIQVSTDDQTYTTVYDYSQISDEYVDSMSNVATLSVFPEDYGATSTFYIRLANTDPSQQYGGGIRRFSINQKQLITSEN